MPDQLPLKRRDLLTSAAIGMTTVGGAIALWPFLSASVSGNGEGPVRFSPSLLDEGQWAMIAVNGEPVLIYKRTLDQIDALRANKPTVTTSKWQDSLFRSRKPEVFVCKARCTREGCMITLKFGGEPLCPCCGSRYDYAGRPTSGIAPKALEIPIYRYISSGEIEFSSLDIEEL